MRALKHLLLFGSTACMTAGYADCVKGVGAVVERTLQVAEFHGIAVEGSMDVVLTRSTERSVVVEAQANIGELVRTEVVDGIWTITTSEGYSTNKDFIIHIHAPVLDLVRIDGSGDVTTTEPFTADRMTLSIHGSGDLQMRADAGHIDAVIAGSGDMVLAGTCGKLAVMVDGSGDVDARGLKAKDADVAIHGSGDVALDASQNLEATIEGSGDVSYKGNPAHVGRNIRGSGDVTPLNRGPR